MLIRSHSSKCDELVSGHSAAHSVLATRVRVCCGQRDPVENCTRDWDGGRLQKDMMNRALPESASSATTAVDED